MKYFSSKVATGNIFCNRTQEKNELSDCVENNEHVVIVAPRRYGKTSLVVQTLNEVKLKYAKVDLFCVVYEEEVARKIAKGVSELTQQLLTLTQKSISFLEKAFSKSKIGFKSGGFDISIDFSHTTTPMEHIEDLLLGLEKIAKKANQKVVFFIDEFQDVLKIDQSIAIQASIRSIAQHSEYVTYIFSGSSRAMLEKIFEDSNQPLYMMCHKLLLDRISKQHFQEHIQKASLNQWKNKLKAEVIDQILSLTECHTYYVNILCSSLMRHKSIITIDDVNKEWNTLMFTYQSKIIAELETLNTNRLKVLVNVALLDSVSEPNSKNFIEKVKLSVSSVQIATKYLIDHDYLMKCSHDDLRLVDPLMKSYLKSKYF